MGVFVWSWGGGERSFFDELWVLFDKFGILFSKFKSPLRKFEVPFD